jgi:hypothetical protein
MKIKVIYFVTCLIFFVNIANGQILKGDTDANLCTIEANPEAFLEKPFNVRAIYSAGFEMGWLDDSCPPRESIRIVYRFDENFDSGTKPKVLKQMNKLLSKKIKIPGDVATVKGVFTIQIKKHIKRNPNENLSDYDIIVLKLISIDRVKK